MRPGVDGRYLIVSGHTDLCGPVESNCQPHPVWLTDGALYDPATDRWTPIAPVPLVSSLGNPVVLGDSVYFLTDRAEILDELAGTDRVLLRYEVDTDTWTSHPAPQKGGGRLVATDSAIIVLSGSDQDGEVDDLVFHPDTDAWSTLPDDPFGPSDRDAVWAGGRLVLSATPLGASEPPFPAVELAVMDAGLSGWSELSTTGPVSGWDPAAAADRVLWRPTGDHYDTVDHKRTHEYYSSVDPATGKVIDIKAGFERGTLAGVWVATRDQIVIEGDLYHRGTNCPRPWTFTARFRVQATCTLSPSASTTAPAKLSTEDELATAVANCDSTVTEGELCAAVHSYDSWTDLRSARSSSPRTPTITLCWRVTATETLIGPLA